MSYPYTGLGKLQGIQVIETHRIARQSTHEDCKVSPTHRPSLSRRRHSWYSFLLEAEWTPVPWCGRKDEINNKSTGTIGNRNRDLQAIVQCLNELRHGGRHVYNLKYINLNFHLSGYGLR